MGLLDLEEPLGCRDEDTSECSDRQEADSIAHHICTYCLSEKVLIPSGNFLFPADKQVSPQRKRFAYALLLSLLLASRLTTLFGSPTSTYNFGLAALSVSLNVSTN
jgi:hypothetical protein